MTPILGPTTITLDQARTWALANNAHERFVFVLPLYLEHAPRYGIPAEVGMAQAAHETAFGRYTGVVVPEFHNWCGLKTRRATGDKLEDHMRFQSDAMGVIAHLQHLCAYAGVSSAGFPDPLFDPRFDLVTKRTATVEGLGGAWAPSAKYGQMVAAHVAALRATVATMPDHDRWISGLIDVRGELATDYSAGHGPDERIPMTEKRGIVVHYGGPPVNEALSSMDVLKAYARYHVSKNWARAGQTPAYGTGLMYHVGIARDGRKYLCRDLDRVLWHCGAWPHNRITLAVQTCIGDGQHITPAQVRALREVCDDWRRATGTPLDEVWGHQELQSTSCPGTVMADFVWPYRDGGSQVAEGKTFPETGHYVGGGFWDYWHANGGLFVFGLPLTDEIQEGGRTVQYFERAVFEFWPENQEPYRVLVRRLGAAAAAAAGYAGVGIP